MTSSMKTLTLSILLTLSKGMSGTGRDAQWRVMFPCGPEKGAICDGKIVITTIDVVSLKINHHKVGDVGYNPYPLTVDNKYAHTWEAKKVTSEDLVIIECSGDPKDVFITAFVIRADDKIAAFQAFPSSSDDFDETFACHPSGDAGFVGVHVAKGGKASVKFAASGFEREIQFEAKETTPQYLEWNVPGDDRTTRAGVDFAKIIGRGLTVVCGDFGGGFSAEALLPSSVWGFSLLAPRVWFRGWKKVDLVLIAENNTEITFGDADRGPRERYRLGGMTAFIGSIKNDHNGTIRVDADAPIQGHMIIRNLDNDVVSSVLLPAVGGTRSYFAYGAPDVVNSNDIELWTTEGGTTPIVKPACGFHFEERPSLEIFGSPTILTESSHEYAFNPTIATFNLRHETADDREKRRNRLRLASQFRSDADSQSGFIESWKPASYEDARNHYCVEDITGTLFEIPFPFVATSGDVGTNSVSYRWPREYLTRYTIERYSNGTTHLRNDVLEGRETIFSIDDLVRVDDVDADYTLRAFLVRPIELSELTSGGIELVCDNGTAYVNVSDMTSLHCLKRIVGNWRLCPYDPDNFTSTDDAGCEGPFGDVTLENNVRIAVEIEDLSVLREDATNVNYAEEEVALFKNLLGDDRHLMILPTDAVLNVTKRLVVEKSRGGELRWRLKDDDYEAHYVCEGPKKAAFKKKIPQEKPRVCEAVAYSSTISPSASTVSVGEASFSWMATPTITTNMSEWRMMETNSLIPASATASPTTSTGMETINPSATTKPTDEPTASASVAESSPSSSSSSPSTADPDTTANPGGDKGDSSSTGVRAWENPSTCNSTAVRSDTSETICCCDILHWTREKFKSTFKGVYQELCTIPPIGGYYADSGDGEQKAPAPTPPPTIAPGELASKTPEERKKIEETTEVRNKNYEMYRGFLDKDCSTVPTSEKQNCEIAQNPQLRGVNDEISTRPEAVAAFKAAQEVSKDFQQEEGMKNSFTNVAIGAVVTLASMVVFLDLPVAVLEAVVAKCLHCGRKPKVAAF